jgi:hypothetical protein
LLESFKTDEEASIISEKLKSLLFGLDFEKKDADFRETNTMLKKAAVDLTKLAFK